MIHSKTCLNQLRETDKCICGSVKQKRENKMDTQIKPDYYVKNIDGSFAPIGMTDTDIDLINKTITVGNELEAKFVLASLRDEHAHALDVLTGKIEVLEAENEDLCTYSRHLNHDYHHITQRVKDLLAAVDKINPDVEGYFEPCNEELCKLRGLVQGGSMNDWNKLILGEEDSQTAPVCNGTVREMIAEIDRLKEELEDAKDEAFKREARIMMYVNKNSDLKRQLDASQALLAEAKEREDVDSMRIHLFDEEVQCLRKYLAEARSSGYWYERYKSCAEHLHLYTDGEEHGTADSCSFCTVVAEINGKLTEVQRQLAEARADNEKLKLLSVSNKTYQCNYCGKSQCVVAPLNKEEIRQEAARECLEIISFGINEQPLMKGEVFAKWLIRNIKAKFKLEG